MLVVKRKSKYNISHAHLLSPLDGITVNNLINLNSGHLNNTPNKLKNT